jgi:hypothetical protein
VLIPILYLKGISTGDFAEALAAVGLSASTVARLKDAWVEEHLAGRSVTLLPSAMSTFGLTGSTFRLG